MDEDVVVSADWLDDHRDEVRIVDVRDAWEYEGIGHVPGAVNIPFDEFRANSASQRDAENANGDAVSTDGEQGMLPDREAWAALLGGAGVSADDTVVAYDDTHGVFAARFLVTALVYGHEDLHVLDGDYSSWMREHATTTAVPEVQPVTYEPRDVETPLVAAADVAAAMDDPDAVLVDTRSPEEYAESHIPGAVNLDWREVVDEETRGLKPRDEVERILAAKGVTRDAHVVLYCNTARRISHTYVVLRWLGYEDVAFYEGSMTEWEAEGRPVESA